MWSHCVLFNESGHPLNSFFPCRTKPKIKIIRVYRYQLVTIKSVSKVALYPFLINRMLVYWFFLFPICLAVRRYSCLFSPSLVDSLCRVVLFTRTEYAFWIHLLFRWVNRLESINIFSQNCLKLLFKICFVWCHEFRHVAHFRRSVFGPVRNQDML